MEKNNVAKRLRSKITEKNREYVRCWAESLDETSVEIDATNYPDIPDEEQHI